MLFSAPITIFGPLLAALYMGQNYLVFRDANRVETFVDHFDTLVRRQAMITHAHFPNFSMHLHRTQQNRFELLINQTNAG